MADTFRKINPNQITAITHLPKKPIFFVTLQNEPNPALVVKGERAMNLNETDCMLSLKWSSKLMKNVQNPQAISKLMKLEEIEELKRAVKAHFAVNSDQQWVIGQPYVWIKMSYLQGLEDCDTSLKSKNTNKALRTLMEKFSSLNFWTQLGRILAVDIFNGNNDRFCVSQMSGLKIGDWTNTGNVFFYNGATIGLDTWDMMSGTSNLGSKGGFQELKTLTDDNLRLEFAKKCASSVGNTLAALAEQNGIQSFFVKIADVNTKIDVANLRTYFTQFRFVQGLYDGIKDAGADLRMYLNRKNTSEVISRKRSGNTNITNNVTNYNLPEGIRSRMQFLGWLN